MTVLFLQERRGSASCFRDLSYTAEGDTDRDHYRRIVREGAYHTG